MQRRTFFKWIGSSVAPIIAPRWAFSQANPFAAGGNATLRALAAVVLPASLGRNRIDAITDQFASWLENYKPGAEMSPGYGFQRVQALPPHPAAHYAEQLRGLETAAARTGAAFTKLDMRARRTLVETTLEEAAPDRISE